MSLNSLRNSVKLTEAVNSADSSPLALFSLVIKASLVVALMSSKNLS